MKHTLTLHHFGPIEDCTLTLSDFTVFTGPQASGKSTIAKAIYYFRSVKQDILNIMMQGGPQGIGAAGADWSRTLAQRLKEKFLQLFGTSWIMEPDMEMSYTYKSKVFIRITLSPAETSGRNYIQVDFSPALQDYLTDLDTHSFLDLTPGQREHEEKALSRQLNDSYETIFIPAGRNLITLLSTQLNYIFLQDNQMRNIDYSTRGYTELILRLKPLFSEGMIGCLIGLEDDPERMKRYKKHRVAIDFLLQRASDVLQGAYRYVDGEERLYLEEDRYIKINFTSSGQQEIVWVFNLLFYYLLNDRKVFLILEEPESHLYPDAQQAVGDVLTLFCNEGNQALITTHSPYLLGTFNYQLLAGQAPKERQAQVAKVLARHFWLTPEHTAAYHVHGGIIEDAFDRDGPLTLIDNGLIDGASLQINECGDRILELLYGEEGDNGQL